MSEFIVKNPIFRPIEELRLTEPGKYIIRKNSKDPQYDWVKNYIQFLTITEHTATNGFWVFLNGNSVRFNFYGNEYEFVGPLFIDNFLLD